MVNLELTISLIGLFVILLGILLIFQKDRLIDIPEGFANEQPKTGIDDLTNPLIKVVKKLSKMTAYFANPEVWTDVYKHSQMSLTDLARSQIAKDAAKDAAKAK
jgi:hypothetical protein